MRKLKNLFFFILDLLRYSPILLVYYISRNLDLKNERNVWISVIKHEEKYNLQNFIWLLKKVPEYKNIFYWRLGKLSFFLKPLYKRRESLHFNMKPDKVGIGLVLQHGFSTIVEAIEIGKNCQIWHNVTVGTNISGSGNKAIIKDNVKICAGAIVLGKIIIGNNVTIGAGAVVVKSVPDNAVVVGNPAKIIKLNNERVDISL